MMMAKEKDEKRTNDGTVDQHGLPAVRATTGRWPAAILLLGNFFLTYIYKINIYNDIWYINKHDIILLLFWNVSNKLKFCINLIFDLATCLVVDYCCVVSCYIKFCFFGHIWFYLYTTLSLRVVFYWVQTYQFYIVFKLSNLFLSCITKFCLINISC